MPTFQTINTGAAANDGTGDQPRTVGIKINANFALLANALTSVPVATAIVVGGVKQGSGVTIAGDGTLSATGTSGVSTFNTRSGAVTMTLADVTGVGGAPLASPTFTGIPAAPTAAGGTNTTQVATTAFVLSAVGAGGGGNPFQRCDPRLRYVPSLLGQLARPVLGRLNSCLQRIGGRYDLADESFPHHHGKEGRR